MSTLAYANRERRVATAGTTARQRRIEESSESRRRRSGYLALKDINCTYHDGEMTLRGRLPTYYLKQIAQHLVAEIKGVRRIIDEIVVLALSGREVVGSEA
ncbi:MAG TPA: BON domain-containing protein [Isosphaeraceae bacterium]|nr:BON domain-containing protein [Isosphaeraceae bacterium]